MTVHFPSPETYTKAETQSPLKNQNGYMVHYLNTYNLDPAFSSLWISPFPVSLTAQLLFCDRLWHSLLQATAGNKSIHGVFF